MGSACKHTAVTLFQGTRWGGVETHSEEAEGYCPDELGDAYRTHHPELDWFYVPIEKQEEVKVGWDLP